MRWDDMHGLLPNTLTGLLIGGRWVVSRDVYELTDRWTGEPVARVYRAGSDQVAMAVDQAEVLAKEWSTRPPSPAQRSTWLNGAADFINTHSAAFGDSIVAETGFTVRDARVEVDRAIGTLRLCAEEARRIGGEVVPVDAQPGSENRIAFTTREPLGIVCAISPFNSPLNTVCHKVGPALAAGNVVILKPASATPVTATLLCDALAQAGMPPGAVSLLIGSGSTVGAQLLEDRRIRGYTFTGSTSVGLEVKQRSGVAKVHLELGANSPTVVLRDARVDQLVESVLRAGYRKAGQVCTSVQRLIVEDSVADDVAQTLGRAVEAMVFGDPHSPDTQVGPLIEASAARHAEAMVADATNGGASVVAGGHRLNGALFEPTLLSDVTPPMRVATEEIFAPVVCIMRAADIREAAAIANGTAYGLQAGIFTQDIDKAMWLAKRLQFGGVIVNDSSSYHADAMPYGGVKDSGLGLEGPRYAIQEMTSPKIIVMNLGTPA